jgi:hypothetical protein
MAQRSIIGGPVAAEKGAVAGAAAGVPGLGLAILMVCCAGRLQAAEAGGAPACRHVVVSDSAKAQQALKSAHDGDTIELAPGNYVLDKVQGFNFPHGVTVTSADPAHPAVLEGLYLQEASGLTFSDLEVKVDARQRVGVIVQGGGRVNLADLDIHGQAVSDGLGVRLMEVKDVTLSNLDIHDVQGGVAIARSDTVSVLNSKIHDLEIDGVQTIATSHLTISGNSFTNFYPKTGDHSDAMQFVGAPAPAHDITITNNTYVRGVGLGNTQGVFMGDEGGAPYQNVTISGNAIVGGVYHGISVYGVDHLDLNHNLVVGYSDITSWILVNASKNARVTDNVATAMNPGKDNVGLAADRNKTIKQPKIGDVAMLAGRPGSAKAGPGARERRRGACSS